MTTRTKKTKPAICPCGKPFMAKHKTGSMYTEYCSSKCANKHSGFMSYGSTRDRLSDKN